MGRAKEKTLRVYARGGILVLDDAYAAASGGRRAYVGRDAVGTWVEDDIPDGVPAHMATTDFLAPGESPVPHYYYPRRLVPQEVTATGYMRKMVRTGSLWPADVETATECGVPFDPTFGGEVSTHSKSGKRSAQE
jgi:hypothetical protein